MGGSERRATAGALATTLVLATVPFWNVLNGSRTAMYGDVNDQHVPMYTGAWRQIRDGDWLWWSPNVLGGTSMVGTGQFAVFYPFNVLFGYLEPTNAFRWWFCLHLWIAAAGAFAWSWHRWRSRTGAVVSALAYVFSGFPILHIVHMPFFAGMAWVPFVFLGIDLVRERWSGPRAAVVAFPLMLMAFLGHVQLLWMTLVGATVYTAAMTLGRRPDWRALLRTGGAAACGLGMGAIQLVPMYLYSRDSQRPSLDMDAAFELTLPPRNLLLFVFPHLYGGSSGGLFSSVPWTGRDSYHEVGSAAGAALVALAVGALFATWRDRSVRALALVAIVGVVVALGDHTPLGSVVYHVVPLAKNFRGWARNTMLVNLVIAMLAGAGVRALLRHSQRALIGVAAAAIGTMTIAILVLHTRSLRPYVVFDSYGMDSRVLPVVLALAVVGAAAVCVRATRLGAAILVLVCVFDLFYFVHGAQWRTATLTREAAAEFHDPDTDAVFGPVLDADGGIDRWMTDTYVFRSVAISKDILGAGGYDPLIPNDYADTAAGLTYDTFPTRPDFWEPGWLSDVLRVSTLILDADITPGERSWRRDGEVVNGNFVRWTREPRLPDAYLVGAVEIAPLDAVRAALTDPQTDLESVAFVERDDDRLADLDDGGEAGEVLRSSVLESATVRVDAERDSLLVLSYAWMPGWHATVDGKSVPVLRTNGLVLGIPVPAGEHTVKVGFRPPGLRTGMALALVSVVALFAACPVARLVGRRRGRRSRE